MFNVILIHIRDIIMSFWSISITTANLILFRYHIDRSIDFVEYKSPCKLQRVDKSTGEKSGVQKMTRYEYVSTLYTRHGRCSPKIPEIIFF